MNKIKIDKIKLIILDQEIELTLDQAKELKKVLEELFPTPKTNFVEVPDKKYPTPDYPYYPPIPVTCEPSKVPYKFIKMLYV